MTPPYRVHCPNGPALKRHFDTLMLKKYWNRVKETLNLNMQWINRVVSSACLLLVFFPILPSLLEAGAEKLVCFLVYFPLIDGGWCFFFLLQMIKAVSSLTVFLYRFYKIRADTSLSCSMMIVVVYSLTRLCKSKPISELVHICIFLAVLTSMRLACSVHFEVNCWNNLTLSAREQFFPNFFKTCH